MVALTNINMTTQHLRTQLYIGTLTATTPQRKKQGNGTVDANGVEPQCVNTAPKNIRQYSSNRHKKKREYDTAGTNGVDEYITIADEPQYVNTTPGNIRQYSSNRHKKSMNPYDNTTPENIRQYDTIVTNDTQYKSLATTHSLYNSESHNSRKLVTGTIERSLPSSDDEDEDLYV
eukprot:m.308095 g.308095  ORF g.308095 m.308095 type:complete len:175 (-) comp16470_c0_seq12:46-570(-)